MHSRSKYPTNSKWIALQSINLFFSCFIIIVIRLNKAICARSQSFFLYSEPIYRMSKYYRDEMASRKVCYSSADIVSSFSGEIISTAKKSDESDVYCDCDGCVWLSLDGRKEKWLRWSPLRVSRLSSQRSHVNFYDESLAQVKQAQMANWLFSSARQTSPTTMRFIEVWIP